MGERPSHNFTAGADLNRDGNNNDRSIPQPASRCRSTQREEITRSGHKPEKFLFPHD
jgi:hypothetical protein